jgi:aspartyl-tRNA(Asn)/glutamyl-tRNA(Gln) amidotransferase subunit C
MAISRDEVHKVALLARLQLSDDQLDTMTGQLNDILGYMDLLGEVDTEQVEPMAHPIELTNVFRADEARGSLDREKALANAPKQNGKCYQVPAVLGDG